MDLFNSSEFTSHVEDLLEQHHIPGLAIAAVQNETIASAGYGKASLSPLKPCTADTIFDIASSSKSLTAASVGLLVDDEKYPDVQYEAIVSELLPGDFVMPGEGYTESVTVEDILSHRSGMPGHDSSYLSHRAAQPDDARSVTRNLRNFSVAAPIRSKYMYCNMMYTVATYLVEKKSGLSFPDFLHQHFFEPLGMKSSHLQPERARSHGLGDRIATGYFWDEEKKEYNGLETPDCPEAQGAGSIMTSVNDYILWVKALMNLEYPINEDIYKGLIKTRTFQNPDGEELGPFISPTVYCAGLEMFYYKGYQIIRHDGCISGFASCHFFLPDFKFGGVILGNAAAAGTVADIIMREFIDEVLKVPTSERPDWNAIESASIVDEKKETEEARQKLCPGITESQPQEKPLDAYTGEYWNAGYHTLTVQIKDAKLFIDATDRSMGFTLTFEHVCDQTKYLAHLADFLEGGDVGIRAEFVFDHVKAVRMGIHFEEDLEELIWFERVA